MTSSQQISRDTLLFTLCIRGVQQGKLMTTCVTYCWCHSLQLLWSGIRDWTTTDMWTNESQTVLASGLRDKITMCLGVCRTDHLWSLSPEMHFAYKRKLGQTWTLISILHMNISTEADFYQQSNVRNSRWVENNRKQEKKLVCDSSPFPSRVLRVFCELQFEKLTIPLLATSIVLMHRL